MLIFAIRLLEGIFVVGVAGCVVVLFLTAIDDLRVLFGGSGMGKDTASYKNGRSAVEAPHAPHEFSRG